MSKEILVPLDGSDPARQALEFALEQHSVLSEAETLAEEYDTDIETETVFGLPRDAIIDYAEDNPIDQIIMGSHGRSGLKRVVIGSVAEKVTRHASVPVTIVHAETGS